MSPVVRHSLFPLILIAGQRALVVGQALEKSEASDTIVGNPITVILPGRPLHSGHPPIPRARPVAACHLPP